MIQGVHESAVDQMCSTCLQIQLVVTPRFQTVVVQAPQPLARQTEVTELHCCGCHHNGFIEPRRARRCSERFKTSCPLGGTNGSLATTHESARRSRDIKSTDLLH